MRWIGFVLLFSALAGTGCLPMQMRASEKPPKVEMQTDAEVPAVMAEEITDQNATDKARALREEMRREATRPETPSAPAEGR